ncbi:YlxR family protein [Isoptericola sediminis]|uniref:YlxR family protein n=1 Tax=Isoptericola sediminis TaxID=2733572 RepID=A0A849K205_9MICO|nr:YlxR family protein [Isoptericola sediminis]NNU26761.1 YlxR family protein [Isoptericola sediminis]
MSSRVRLEGIGSRGPVPARPAPTPPRPVGPVRTCVGCRQRDLRSQLLRLVLVTSDDAPRVAVDVRACLPGRGAWIHEDLACLDRAVRRRAVPRALRAGGPVDLEPVRAYLEHQDR